MAPDELLTEIRVPIRPGSGSAYVKVHRRAGDWPVGASCAFLLMNGDRISEAGIGLAAVGAEHFSAAEAEEALRGAPVSEASFARAGQVAAEHCHPVSDQRGPADYKRHLAAELTVLARGMSQGPTRRPAARTTTRLSGYGWRPVRWSGWRGRILRS